MIASDTECACCGQARGFIYTGPVYSEEDDLEDALCPWCIASGQAAKKFDATFVDSEAFSGDIPPDMAEEIVERTPGYCAWQSESWPVCCGSATAFLYPAGTPEIRNAGLEGTAMMYIVHEMGISGGAATRLLGSLRCDQGPTAYVFKCLECGAHRLSIDQM